MMDDQVVPDPSRIRWFSHEISQSERAWIFKKGQRPALVTSTFDPLAVLVTMKLFYVDDPWLHRTRIQVLLAWTHNRGNGSALNKLMTTKNPRPLYSGKWPLCAENACLFSAYVE